MDLQLDEQVAVKRTNGKYHLTKINKILDCDKIEVTWVENGERFIKKVRIGEIMRIRTRHGFNLKNIFFYFVCLFLLYLVINGIASKYFELEEAYNECLVEKKMSWSELFFTTKCLRPASFWNATFTTFTDMFIHLSEAIGGFLNGFIKSVFNGIGILRYFEVFFSVFIIFLSIYLIKFFFFK